MMMHLFQSVQPHQCYINRLIMNLVDSDLTGLRFKRLLKCESSTVLTVVLTLIDNPFVIDIHVL